MEWNDKGVTMDIRDEIKGYGVINLVVVILLTAS